MTTDFRIAVIPGDGIGKEVMPEGLRVLDAAASRFGLRLRYTPVEWASCDYYARSGPARDAHDAIVAAIEHVLANGPHTADLGVDASTTEMGRAIAERVARGS